MLRGIDGVHTWTSPDAVTLRLNELDDVSTGAPKWPRYRLLDVDHGYPEAGATAHKRIGQAGAVAHPDYRGSRIHTYTIEVMGRTIDELRQAEEDLEAAFYDQSAEGRMDVGTHPLNPDYSAANDRYFNAKAGNLIPGTNAPDSDLSPELGFRREWVIDMRNHEGVYYEELTPDTFKQAIIDLGPSLYWALDAADGADDLSGNGNDGTGAGGITIGGGAALTPIPGDSATDFGGTDDLITATGYKLFDPLGSDRTFLCLVDLTVAGHLIAAVGSSGGLTPSYIQIGGDLADVIWAPDPSGGGSSHTWEGAGTFTSPTPLAVTVADDTPSAGSSTAELFVSGISKGAAEVSDVVAASADLDLVLGDWGLIGTNPTGAIGHFAVFERVLSDAEVANIHALASTGAREYV